MLHQAIHLFSLALAQSSWTKVFSAITIHEDGGSFSNNGKEFFSGTGMEIQGHIIDDQSLYLSIGIRRKISSIRFAFSVAKSQIS